MACRGSEICHGNMYFFITVLYVSFMPILQGVPCPKPRRAHVSDTTLFYYCINLLPPNGGHVWIPARCSDGLVFHLVLNMCVISSENDVTLQGDFILPEQYFERITEISVMQSDYVVPTPTIFSNNLDEVKPYTTVKEKYFNNTLMYPYNKINTPINSNEHEGNNRLEEDLQVQNLNLVNLQNYDDYEEGNTFKNVHEMITSNSTKYLKNYNKHSNQIIDISTTQQNIYIDIPSADNRFQINPKKKCKNQQTSIECSNKTIRTVSHNVSQAVRNSSDNLNHQSIKNNLDVPPVLVNIHPKSGDMESEDETAVSYISKRLGLSSTINDNLFPKKNFNENSLSDLVQEINSVKNPPSTYFSPLLRDIDSSEEENFQGEKTMHHLIGQGNSYMSINSYKTSILPLLKGDGLTLIPCTTGVRMPNLTDCTKYYVCNSTASLVHSYICPNKTAFNQYKRICEARAFSICQAKQDMNIVPSVKTVDFQPGMSIRRNRIVTNPTTISPSYVTTTQYLVMTDFATLPPCTGSGKFIDPTSNSHYYLCARSKGSAPIKRLRVLCPNGLQFCASRGTCKRRKECIS